MALMELNGIVYFHAGNVLKEQVEAFQSISQDLSAISLTSNSIALATVHGGLASWTPGSYVHVNSTSMGSSNLRFCALKLCITLTTPDPWNKSLLPVAVLQVDSLDVDLFLNQGLLEALALEVLGIVLFQHASKLRLLQCKTGEELVIRASLELLVDPGGPVVEVHISLPSTEVWLHIAAWSEIGPVIAACLKQSQPQTVSGDPSLLDASPDSSKTPPNVENFVLQEDLDYSACPRQDTHLITLRTSLAFSNVDIPMRKSQQSKNGAVLAKVGTFRLALLVLDSPSRVHKSERAVEDENPSLPQESFPGKLLSCALSLRIDEFRFNNDGTWTLAAAFSRGEGNLVEIFEDEDAFQELCFQATEMSIFVDGGFQQSPILRFDLKVIVECISFWCSYPILRFFREFTFEEVKAGPHSSFRVEGKAGLCLQHASILLSDGRVSFECQSVCLFVTVSLKCLIIFLCSNSMS